MGLFSFGGSKSESSSYGQSSSYDQAQSGSVSGGASTAGSVASSSQSVAFEDVFARLFGGAEGAAAGLDPSMLTEAANTLFSGGTGFLDSLSGGAGRAYQEERLSADNPVLLEQISGLQDDIGRLFSEELLPGITSEAVGGGTLGGGRQGVAEGRAIDTAAREFTRGATALRAGDIGARDAVAGNLRSGDVGAATAGLAGLAPLAGIANMGYGAGLDPYARLAEILGGPLALTESSSSSFANSADFARAFSESFGSSQSTTRSSSSSKDIRFGFGGGK